MMLAIYLLSALVIFAVGLFSALNNMTRETRHCIRVAWIVLTTGSFGVLLAPLYGYVSPTLSEVTLNVGIALFVVANRRKACAFCKRVKA